MLNDFKDWIGLCLSGLLAILWLDIRSIRIKSMNKETHDEICELKLKPIIEKLDELHDDVKELLKR